MKFLSSSSSSSTATTGGGGNASGCITGMFRRLLCSNSLPTHPSDHVSSVFPHPSNHAIAKIHQTKHEEEKHSKKIESLSSSGVVARLMGLESMPRVETNHKSISRSQSMNSMDSLRELKKEKSLRACSFREIPTYLELEDENFFILSFEYGRKSAEFRSKQRKTEKVKNICKRRESVYHNKENLDINHVSDENLGILVDGKLQDSTNILKFSAHSTIRKEVSKKREEYKQEKFKKKKKERRDCCLDSKKIEADCDSEKSSPNSVLGFVEFPAIQEIPSSEKISKLENSKSRRTLSEELENYRELKLISDDLQPKRSEKVYGAPAIRKNDVKLWGEICGLADVETVQNNWQHKEIWEHEEIGGNFELGILDDLIGELVNQLIIDSHTISNCNLTELIPSHDYGAIFTLCP